MTRIALEPYFLHQEQVQGVIGTARTDAAMARAAAMHDPETALPYMLAAALAEALPALGIGELLRSVHEQSIRIGQVAGIECIVSFRRVRDLDEPGVKHIAFDSVTGNGELPRVTGSFNGARTTSASATGSLRGSRRVYLIGTITDLDGGRIELRPAFIGVRSFIDEDELDTGAARAGLRIYPSEIGQFRGVDFLRPAIQDELTAVLTVPEKEVKRAIADLFGEPYVPKDWGGERSDLYTSRVFARGRQMSSAWLLKGPGFPRPMTVKALGDRGDQIGRLFSEPAELLVLQHCHEITTAVVNMMDAYAHDVRNPRRYMILDGADTGRILKSAGLIR